MSEKICKKCNKNKADYRVTIKTNEDFTEFEETCRTCLTDIIQRGEKAFWVEMRIIHIP